MRTILPVACLILPRLVMAEELPQTEIAFVQRAAKIHPILEIAEVPVSATNTSQDLVKTVGVQCVALNADNIQSDIGGSAINNLQPGEKVSALIVMANTKSVDFTFKCKITAVSK